MISILLLVLIFVIYITYPPNTKTQRVFIQANYTFIFPRQERWDENWWKYNPSNKRKKTHSLIESNFYLKV
jgi:hypothetical protein